MLNYITRAVFGVLIIFISSCSTEETIPKEETLITYNLTTKVLPENSGSVSTSGEVYEKGEEVSLEAIPVEGFAFKEWEGGVEGQDNPVKFTMDSDKTITAVFEKVTYSLSIDILGKWAITTSRSQEKTSTKNECSLISIEFQVDGVFIIITTEGEIRGTYTISGDNSLDLGIGTITNLDLSDVGVLSFTINLEGNCSSILSGLLLTHIPDDGFEQVLIDRGYDDVLDNYVFTSNIEFITELNIYDTDPVGPIKNLTGIEDFVNLKRLILQYHGLAEVNLSSNLLLENLDLVGNQLSNLDIINNIVLTGLYLNNNQLTSLDISKTTALTTLSLNNNQLASMNISKNTALTSLHLANNQITSIDLGANTSITRLSLGRNQLTSIDLSANTALTNLSLYFNQLIKIDISQNNALTDLNLTSNQLKSIDLSANTLLTYLGVDFNPDLTCIKVNQIQLNAIPSEWRKDEGASYSLDCSNPNGTKTYVPDDNFEQALIDLGYDDIIDDYVLTENIETIQVFEYDGADKPIDLKIIDLTGIEDFRALQSLKLPYNEISNIHLTTNVDLLDLILTGNNLSSIDLSNNVNLDHFWLNENEFREFRLSDINNIVFFTLSNNPLTIVDLENIDVGEFDINNSTIDILNLKNVTVGEVHIDNNDLSTINFENTSIGMLNLRGNTNLTIDFSGLKNVWLLSIHDTPITELEIASLPVLNYLDLYNTDLTTIDLSSNTLLKRLEFDNNNFSELNVSMLDALEYVEATNNNLSCIKISESQLESVTWKIDEGVNLSEECN